MAKIVEAEGADSIDWPEWNFPLYEEKTIRENLNATAQVVVDEIAGADAELRVKWPEGRCQVRVWLPIADDYHIRFDLRDMVDEMIRDVTMEYDRRPLDAERLANLRADMKAMRDAFMHALANLDEAAEHPERFLDDPETWPRNRADDATSDAG